jgi:manganese-dependent inorganic pyrophosphatase
MPVPTSRAARQRKSSAPTSRSSAAAVSRFGVGQGSFMTEGSRKAAEALVGPYLPDGASANDIPMVFYMFTDVKSQTTELLYSGPNTEAIVSRAFGVKPVEGIATLPGVVSRKKQVIPALMSTLQAMQEEDGE